MGLIKITSDKPEDLFKPGEFPVISPGKHLFVVANKLEAAPAKESGNKIIKLEARCQDETDEKGMPVWHNFVLIENPTTDKQAQGKDINDRELAQFTAACGVLTPEQIANGEEFDLDDFYEKTFSAVTKVTMEDTYPKEYDENGNVKKRRVARIAKFLFEPQAG